MLFVAVAFVIALVVFAVLRLALAGKNLSLSRFFSLYLGSLIGIAMTFLGLTGRLHWLFVLLGPTLPFLGSIFKWASRLWGMGKLVRRYRAQGAVLTSSNRMTESEALETLGLEPGASDEEINEAKDLLLK